MRNNGTSCTTVPASKVELSGADDNANYACGGTENGNATVRLSYRGEAMLCEPHERPNGNMRPSAPTGQEKEATCKVVK
ncbi:hypothetical protein PIB30_091011 [Stylosanthes scabra]|uniref:Lipoprotein n=1 Tax=Stylosanthes scabra TaxID=79078 RepID=A0ABU6WUF1_9FABA|nr:hypothetical protein [Stylosanthes scabra]